MEYIDRLWNVHTYITYCICFVKVHSFIYFIVQGSKHAQKNILLLYNETCCWHHFNNFDVFPRRHCMPATLHYSSSFCLSVCLYILTCLCLASVVVRVRNFGRLPTSYFECHSSNNFGMFISPILFVVAQIQLLRNICFRFVIHTSVRINSVMILATICVWAITRELPLFAIILSGKWMHTHTYLHTHTHMCNEIMILIYKLWKEDTAEFNQSYFCYFNIYYIYTFICFKFKSFQKILH